MNAFSPRLRSVIQKRSFFVACLCASLLKLYVILPSTEAASKNSLKVSPAFIEIDVQKVRESTQFPISYTNTSNKQIQVVLSFLPVTFANDNTRLEFPITQSVLVNHLFPSSTEFTIAPNETKNIVLTSADLNLLAEADYYEALVAKISSTEQTSGRSTSIVGNITTLLLVRNITEDRYPIYTIARPNHILPAVSTHIPSSISFVVQNGGKTYGTPRGKLTIKDMFGRVIAQGAINEDSVRIFPQTERSLVSPLFFTNVPLPVHMGFVELSLRDEYSQHNTSPVFLHQAYAYIDPLFGVSLAVAGVLFFLYVSQGAKKRTHHVDPTS